MDGFIALYRKITENEFYFSEKFTKILAWIDLLLLASHKNRIIYIRNIEIKLKAGELCYSQKSLANRWKWNYKTVKKFLKLLEKLEMVVTKTDNVTTIISIKNWKNYQVSNNKIRKENRSYGEQNGEQKVNRLGTNNNVNNENNNTTIDKREIKKTHKLSYRKSILYSVVYLYSKILNRQIESADYAFINRLLKLKENDSLTHLQKYLMLCFALNSIKELHNHDKFKGILYNKFKELNYTDFNNFIKKKIIAQINLAPDTNILKNPSINY